MSKEWIAKWRAGIGLGLMRWQWQRAANRWAKEYRRYLSGATTDPPWPAVVHVIVTENCNLRCPMCNQWGENGYLASGKRLASSAPLDDLIRFLEQARALRPDYTLSLNGGETLAYPQIGGLLEYVAERRTPLLFYTNGTLLARHARAIAKVNPHGTFFISIDGGPEAHGRIRGKHVLPQVREGLRLLNEECRNAGTGYPKVMLNCVVCELNANELHEVEEFAREVGALALQYNLRWFLPDSAGRAYDEILLGEFGAKPTQAWTGWLTRHSLAEAGRAAEKLYARVGWKRLLRSPGPPWIVTMPPRLSPRQARRYYEDFSETFGISKCVMPSYMVRIYSNGDLVYCPGHPDLVAGNVFREDFSAIYRNALSTQLRKRVEKQLLPICNRCCGLYMTDLATRNLPPGFSTEK